LPADLELAGGGHALAASGHHFFQCTCHDTISEDVRGSCPGADSRSMSRHR
jgi:hypothetical protein